MSPLLVIAGLSDPGPAAHAELPQLPGLSELLRLSDAAGMAADWRSGMLRDLGCTEHSQQSPAAIAAAALSLPAGAAVCMATPVHAVAGLNRVHLHAAGALQLDVEHSAAFATGFAAQFGDDLRLHALEGGWLIEAACAIAADDEDPLNVLGMPLERAAARSAEQRQLHLLGAEIEMWLAALPLNRDRARRGELPANLLWMWGGGRVGPQPRGTASSLCLYSADSDPWLTGCASLVGATRLPLAGWDVVPRPRDAVIVLQATAATDAKQLQHWDEQWFQPLVRDLRARRIAALRLRVGRRALYVRRRLWSAPWRRGRHWWQVAAA
jgi:hypothetical protein